MVAGRPCEDEMPPAVFVGFRPFHVSALETNSCAFSKSYVTLAGRLPPHRIKSAKTADLH